MNVGDLLLSASVLMLPGRKDVGQLNTQIQAHTYMHILHTLSHRHHPFFSTVYGEYQMLFV